MPDTMPDTRLILVPVFLLAQAVLVHWAGKTERPPAPPVLAQFPDQVGPWKKVAEDPIAADVAAILGADQTLSRTYVIPSGLTAAGLFVAWFQSQRGGASKPHSPKVCLPGSGWQPEATGEMTLDTAAGAIAINRYVVVNGKQRAVVLYWYQTPRRAVAGEWAAKFWLVADALRDHRTDTSLVRVTVWSSEGQDQAATASAAGFARDLYPALRTYLPR